MSARDDLLSVIGFNDAANQGTTPDQLLDAYRAEVLREAADAVFALDYDDQVGDEESNGSIREAWDLGTVHATELLCRMADEAGKSASEDGEDGSENTQLAALAKRLREIHYEVDGSPDAEGSCIADGHDYPCPTLRAIEGDWEVPAGFFRPGRTYAYGQTGYRAPELTVLFRVEHITRHPDRGHLRAIGWMRSGEPDAKWHGHFQDEDEFDGWTEITEGGAA